MLTVFYPLHNARWLAALGAIRAFGGVHCLLAVTGFGDLCHGYSSLLAPSVRRLES